MKVGKWSIVDESTCKWIEPPGRGGGGIGGGGIAGIIIAILAFIGGAGAGFAYKEKKWCFASKF